MRSVLGLNPWSKQQEIARLLLSPPYRVLVKSSHSVGKSWLAAALTSWWYDTRPHGCVLTTAPTDRDVKDVLWREVRLQRGRAGLGGFKGDVAAEIRSAPDHYAKGFTAAKGESFQGRHQKKMLFIFDEAIGIKSQFWETTRSMFNPDGDHAWLCPFNPTDTSSRAHLEEQLTDPLTGLPMWHVVTMSSLDHPNLVAGLRGKPAPYPGAVTLAQFEDWLVSWCDPSDETPGPTDIEWPPGSGRYWRVGP